MHPRAQFTSQGAQCFDGVSAYPSIHTSQNVAPFIEQFTQNSAHNPHVFGVAWVNPYPLAHSSQLAAPATLHPPPQFDAHGAHDFLRTRRKTKSGIT